jgi:hypothetical protein
LFSLGDVCSSANPSRVYSLNLPGFVSMTLSSQIVVVQL